MQQQQQQQRQHNNNNNNNYNNNNHVGIACIFSLRHMIFSTSNIATSASAARADACELLGDSPKQTAPSTSTLFISAT